MSIENEFVEFMQVLNQVHNLNFRDDVYPIVIDSGLDPVDIVDILAIIKDIDVHKYLLLDTRVRDYFDDICFKIFESLDDCEEA